MRRNALIVVLFGALASGHYCSGQAQTLQSITTNPKEFDAASFRLDKNGDSGLTEISPWGSHEFRATHISLLNLLSIAYAIDGRYITGIPDNLSDATYTLVATSTSSGLSYEAIHAPLQQLLAERLHVQVRHVTKKTNGYELTPAKSGLKINPVSHPGQRTASIFQNQLIAHSVTMKSLAAMLALVTDTPVKDTTDLTGIYDIDLKFSRSDDQNPTEQSVFAAVQDQLGLKLVPTKVAIDTLTLDHVDPVPVDN